MGPKIGWHGQHYVINDRGLNLNFDDCKMTLHDKLSASSSTSALWGFWSFVLNTTFPNLLNKSSYVSSVSSLTFCKIHYSCQWCKQLPQWCPGTSNKKEFTIANKYLAKHPWLKTSNIILPPPLTPKKKRYLSSMEVNWKGGGNECRGQKF